MIVSEKRDESQQVTGNLKIFPVIPQEHRREFSLVFATLFIAFTLLFVAVTAPSSELVTRGEAREGLVVQAMIAQNNSILPLRNGTEIPSKPPLFHWSGLAFENLGLSPEFSLRLPSALAAGVMVVLIFSFSAPLLGSGGAAVAGLLFYVTFDVLRLSRAARVDMMFSLWVSGGLFALFLVVNDYVQRGKKNSFALFLATLSIALAILTKGPAGLVLPWAVAGLSMLALVPFRKIPFTLAALSIAGSLIIAGIWYFLAYTLGGDRFIDVHLMRENYARVVGLKSYSTGHEGKFFMPFLMLLAGLLPATTLLPLVVPTFGKLWSRPTERPLALYFALWALIFPVFFSFTASQRNAYLLPCYPAWAFFMALALLDIPMIYRRSPGLVRFTNRLLQISACVFATVSALVLVFLFAPSVFEQLLELFHTKKNEQQLILSIIPATRASIGLLFLLVLCLPLSVAAVGLFQRLETLRGYVLLAAVSLCLQLSITNFILPHLAEKISPERFAEQALSLVRERGGKLYQYDDNFFALNYYAKENLPRLNEEDKVPSEYPLFLLMRSRQVVAAREKFPTLEVVAISELLDFYGKDRFVLVAVPLLS